MSMLHLSGNCPSQFSACHEMPFILYQHLSLLLVCMVSASDDADVEPLYVTQRRLLKDLLHSGYDKRALPAEDVGDAVPVTFDLRLLGLDNVVSSFTFAF